MGKLRNIFVLVLTLMATHCMIPKSVSIAAVSDSHPISTRDESTLLAFKAEITSQPYNILSRNWTRGTNFCNWIGITCGRRHKRVRSLNLFNMSLKGTIAKELGNLSFLVALDLGTNSFHGPIPDELGHLGRLRFVYMKFNELTGGVPVSFGFLRKLQVLDLSNNYLAGSIYSAFLTNISTLVTIGLSNNHFFGSLPLDFCDTLPNLEELYLSGNQLDGEIPSTLQKCKGIRVLSLANNQLIGTIPEEIGSSSKLQELYLDYNNLTGLLPWTIFNVASLVKISLSNNMISGSLPDDLCFRLVKLESLNLSVNQIGGQIPPSLSHCSALKYLRLFDNKFTGSLPRNIGNLSALELLSLSLNNLSGNMPSEIGNLLMLQRLNVQQNNFFGTIPSSIGNLTNLEDLILGVNFFHGNIPPELGQLPRLKWLDAAINQLAGELPRSISNISTLEVMALLMNNFSGNLASVIVEGAFPNLQRLHLGANLFSGSFLSSISNFSKLQWIDLGENLLSGPTPMNLGNLRDLQLLQIETNQLTNNPSTLELSFLNSLVNCKYLRTIRIEQNLLNGTLPKSIGNLSSSLEEITAYSCGIKGLIAREFGNLRNIIKLDLDDNELVGFIPETFGQLTKMQSLGIAGNKIHGPIPSTICNMKYLYYLNLERNHISGSLLECLGELPLLRELYVGDNALNSTVPAKLWSSRDISVLNLSLNILDGSLGLEISNMKSLRILDLSNNHFSSFIPSGVGQLQDLVTLNLSQNKLNGSIPELFVNLVSLEQLDLSNNSLSGPIPMSLEKLQFLAYFNVSFNELSGEIPNGGPFANFTAESFAHNFALCGPSRFKVKACKDHKSQLAIKVRLLKFIPVSILSVLIAASLVFWLLRCGRDKNVQLPIENNSLLTVARISCYEILHATNSFDESNLIGEGSLGSVYKGEFSSGIVAAVKVFNVEMQGAFKSFDVECQVLRNIRHRNLVKVISSCSNLDFKALVLDFMPNGSLDKWLYSHNYCLDINQRLEIMIDVASALQYLHHDYMFPIVHCDLKPRNILLDEDMTAHVSDFGISKLLGENTEKAQTKTLGTIGYMSPEYGSEGIVSTSADVYSYGILLIETFTRRKPTDEMFLGDLTMTKWVSESFPGVVMEIIDANLLTGNARNFDNNIICLTSVMELALECTANLPESRISMKDVWVKLKKIHTTLQQNVIGS